MTELQPTEIELTAKSKKPASVSKRKIVAFVVLIVIIALIAAFTIVLANRASHAPESLQPQNQGQVVPTEANPKPAK